MNTRICCAPSASKLFNRRHRGFGGVGGDHIPSICISIAIDLRAVDLQQSVLRVLRLSQINAIPTGRGG